MIKFLKGLPPDVLAFEATGQVTHADYRDLLVPKAEAMMGHGPVKVLYVIGPEFTGFDLGAMADDGVLWVRHWHDFIRIAVVTDLPWLKTTVAVFRPFLHGETRVFGLAGLDAAKAWIVEEVTSG
jgi:hypothetical protein